MLGGQSRCTRTTLNLNNFDIFAGTFCDFGEHCGIETCRRVISQNQIERRKVASYTDFNCFRTFKFWNFNFGRVLSLVDFCNVVINHFVERAVVLHFVDSSIEFGLEGGVFLANGEAEIIGKSFEGYVGYDFIFVIFTDEIIRNVRVKTDLVDAVRLNAHLHVFQAVVISDRVIGNRDVRFFFNHL